MKYHKLLVAVSSCLFLWALASLLLREDVSIFGEVLKDSSFEIVPNETVVERVMNPWLAPESLNENDWLFDVFTPPVIYYDEETRTFTVKSSQSNEGGLGDLRLLEITRRPFRLQLASYAGGEGNYMVTLFDRETGKDVFCSPGEELDGMDAILTEFVVKRVVPENLNNGGTEVFDWVGEATLEDHRTGELYKLMSNHIVLSKTYLGVLQLPSGNTVTLHEGQSWVNQETRYSLTRIDSNLQNVTLEQTALDGSFNRTKILPYSNIPPDDGF